MTPSEALNVVPDLTEMTGKLCFAEGCDFPLVLRPTSYSTYKILDDAYTHRYMYGEI